MKKIDIKFYSSFHNNELVKSWKKLYLESENTSFFSSYEWNYNLSKYLYKDNKYFIVAIFKNDSCVGIIPLYLSNKYHFKIYFT